MGCSLDSTGPAPEPLDTTSRQRRSSATSQRELDDAYGSVQLVQVDVPLFAAPTCRLVRVTNWVQNLQPDDVEIIGRLLVEVVGGPYFPEWEFQTLFGLTRFEVRNVADIWPHTTDPDRAADVVIQSLSQLRGYPHGQDARLQERLGLDDRGLEQLRDRVLAGTR